ncbi:MAG: prepilin-type N-terminal cleavage/methylation domain-containing protein [Planctomycetes bacterium]|nr:prepilin-type N-terminal cleavage/methylation domain-containing protein [Planctomycetota bacterium]MCB9908739.1 prepilin-type N-terminal cleavage/methylation domain-containing protein [Planctomycetota bacterium]MCB9912436.1 prepilin-type N-terminal cleavage/methylation domain-containing protein [Planctomycetota bacterium]HPF13693.1 prepilin-type N-terminal cleavage/methylation domain-containing protein [Planctomycetota bacterium]HRV81104.1 prepilin-type N-terminal cleavage/methylation domain
MQRQPQTVPARAGFTLIEVMAVLVILSILMAYLITSLSGSGDVVHGKNTRMFLDQVESLLVDFETQKGDFPPSTFPANLPELPSTTNMGSEMLVLALFPADGSFQAADLPEDRMSNTDVDSTKKALSSFPSGEVFELADDWGNPIAYIHRRDYGKRFLYQTMDPTTGEPIDGDVAALKSPKTGDYYQRKRFQLISAGPDGVFGTEDDITNFARETQ